MKGGSIASDAVTTLVNDDAYSKMNVMFENTVPSKAGGGCGCNRGGRGACAIHKKGGGIVRQMMSNNTLNAFKGGNSACGARATGAPKRGGGGTLPSMTQLIESDASFDMRVQNRQSGGRRSRCMQRGGADDNKPIEINPSLDLRSYSFTPKQPLVASPVDVIASEGVSALPLIQKYTMYGQTSNDAMPFSYGEPVNLVPMKPIQTSVVTGFEMKGGKGKKKSVPSKNTSVKPAANQASKTKSTTTKAKTSAKPQPQTKKPATTASRKRSITKK